MPFATNAKRKLTGSDGAGILAYAGIGGVAPPLKAFEDVRAVVTDLLSRGIRARDAIVFALPSLWIIISFTVSLRSQRSLFDALLATSYS